MRAEIFLGLLTPPLECSECSAEQHSKFVALIETAHETLKRDQYQLLSAHIQSMRQRDEHRDYYSIVENSLEELVCFVVSSTDQGLEHACAVRLRELQLRFLENKKQFLKQLAEANEAEERLYTRQYAVSKQQAWFVSCLRKLSYEAGQGRELDGETQTDSGETPDSVWAATMWKLLDEELNKSSDEDT